MLLLLLAPLRGAGQTFTSINFPSDLCAGADTTVSFGYNSAFNIVVDTGHATLGHSDRIFLPDGQPCGTLGCSYRSPVTFTDFAAGASITSGQDIKYIRLNMEHSYIGDIYINITCPNGQKADIMRFGGTNNSSCSIPAASKNWLSGSNMSSGAFFGEAYDYGASNKCDSGATTPPQAIHTHPATPSSTARPTPSRTTTP